MLARRQLRRLARKLVGGLGSEAGRRSGLSCPYLKERLTGAFREATRKKSACAPPGKRSGSDAPYTHTGPFAESGCINYNYRRNLLIDQVLADSWHPPGCDAIGQKVLVLRHSFVPSG